MTDDPQLVRELMKALRPFAAAKVFMEGEVERLKAEYPNSEAIAYIPFVGTAQKGMDGPRVEVQITVEDYQKAHALLVRLGDEFPADALYGSTK